MTALRASNPFLHISRDTHGLKLMTATVGPVGGVMNVAARQDHRQAPVAAPIPGMAPTPTGMA